MKMHEVRVTMKSRTCKHKKLVTRFAVVAKDSDEAIARVREFSPGLFCDPLFESAIVWSAGLSSVIGLGSHKE